MRADTTIKKVMLTAAIVCVAVGLLITLGAVGITVFTLWSKFLIDLGM